ncbi:MAG: hypothetical protein ABFS41_04985 [Myxococcota bacterium]
MLRARMGETLQTRIVEDVRPSDVSPRRVRRALEAHLAEGGRLRPAGTASSRPRTLLAQYPPRSAVSLFDAQFQLSDLREDDNFRFFVAYVRLGEARDVYPRLLYKDQSLVWRCATHYIATPGTLWVGKGDMKVVGGTEYSAEETTNLPLEIQAALDDVSRRTKRVVFDGAALRRLLRRAPKGRFEAYADFLQPRRRAAARRANRVNGGRPVAWFTRPGDPGSLRFAPGFAPDFSRVVDVARSASRMYGGAIRKLRILSRNRQIQYQFVASPRLVWIIPAQTLTTELSTYGVRTLDVVADEDLFVPGYEYHYVEDGELYSQIPKGFAGAISEIDPTRADAGPWLERLPVIREFRRRIPDPLAW